MTITENWKENDMATASIVEPSAQGGEITTIVAQTPVVVLIDDRKRSDLYDHIRREVEAFTHDLTTAKGRDAIKSFAYKITRTKTAIDDAGKKLNEDARAKINAVDAARRDARNTLDMFAEQVLKPLTDWEDAEKARASKCRDTITRIKEAATVTIVDTTASVRKRGAEIWQIELAPDVFGDMLDEALSAKDGTVAALKSALDRLTREEEERAELEALRAEKEERARLDAERVAEEARKAAEEEEKRATEARRLAEEKAEADRIDRLKAEAVAQAQHEAAEAALVEQARIQAEHDELLAAERRRAEEAERSAKAEQDRIAAEQAKAEAAAAEQRERDENQAHRARVKTKVKQALMICGADEKTARNIVLAIQSGEIPNVSMRF